MKRFTFRLQPVLELKRRAEETVKHAIAKNNREKYEAQEHLRALANDLQTLTKEEGVHRTSVLNASMLRAAVAFRHKLGADMRAADKKIETISARGGQLRDALVAARKETRAIELVREKRLALWKKEVGKKEQQFADDVSQQKYVRALNATAEQRHAAG
jgi:flagellar FliJ protein